ncbi:hypothetical protein EG872_16210, partial [Enterococcus faecalis]
PAGAALPRRPREPGGGLLGVPGRVRALPHGPAPGAGRGLGAAGGRVAGGPRGGARGRQAQVRVPLPRHHARRRQGARAAAGGRGRALAPRRARVHPARGGHAHAGAARAPERAAARPHRAGALGREQGLWLAAAAREERDAGEGAGGPVLEAHTSASELPGRPHDVLGRL